MELMLLPFVANILILIPAALGTLTGTLPISAGKFPESTGWRQLIGSLWTGILACSLLALRNPKAFWPILLLQVVYKATWLGAYVAPRLASSSPAKRQEVHWGLTLTFLPIVLCWPAFVPWSQVLGTGFPDGPLFPGEGLGLLTL